MIAAPAEELGSERAAQQEQVARVARNVGFLGASQALTWALAVLYTLVVARLLGPAGMGALVVGWSIAGLAEGFAGLGSRPLLVKSIVRDPEQGPALLGTAIMVRGALLVPCAVAAYAYARLGHFSGEEVGVIFLGLGVALGFLTQEAIQGGLQAIERMEFLALSDVINKTLLTVVSIPLALFGFGPAWLMGVNVAVMGIVVVANLFWIRRIGIEWSFDLQRVRDFIAASLAYWAFALFYTVYLWIDSALLALLGSAQEVGWYGVSTRLFQTMMFLPVILCTAWLPRLAAAYRRSGEDLKQTAALPIQLIGTLAMPIAVGTAVVAGPLVVMLYGPSFGPAQPVLAILALTAIPTYLNIVLSQVLIAADKQAAWTRILVVASIVNPVLNVVLIPFFHTRFDDGALGASICMLVTELLVVVLGAAVARPYLSLAIAARFTRAALATVVMAGAVVLVARAGAFVQIAAGLIVFLALSRPAGLISGEEMRELAPLARRVPFLGRLAKPALRVGES